MRNMGGLRRYLPLTASMMGIAWLAIAGVPPFAGFFSKDEILSSVFTRAHGSPLASASLLGISGTTVLLVVYGLGLLTALLTALYMTRLMLLTFAGANRSGEASQRSLKAAPGMMTGPVIVLALLTMVGGWINLPGLLPLGPVGLLERWLLPVTGASAARLAGMPTVSHESEQLLLGVAVSVAAIGIGLAFMLVRYRGAVSDKARAVPSAGVALALEQAYGVDAGIDALLVRPFNVIARSLLTRGVEAGVDRAFSGGGTILARTAARVGARMQDGDVGKVAWMIVIGAVAVLAALAWQ
ncbi:MAG: hypothetical protein IPP90_17245 [Gemmatimonadaceae bacterium]|nr:hypothetical protein [Gemmatimonadaceae bacterium]